MATSSLFTPKFFGSDIYKALQAPYNDRMAREAAARNPLAPSQGGSWPQSRPPSTALTPQNYNPVVPPHVPNDPNRATADMRVPGMVPFPPAYPARPPVDITVRGPGTGPSLAAMFQPWEPENMLETGNAGGLDPNAGLVSAFAPEAAPAPAVSAINAATAGGAPAQPQTSWMEYAMPGLSGLFANAAPKPPTPAEEYQMAINGEDYRARSQNRSGIGTDGYVRDADGNVTGRDPKYAGMSPEQMYNALSGRPQDDSWKTIGPSGSDNKRWRDFGFSSEREYAAARGEAPDAQRAFDQAMRDKLLASGRVGSTGGSGPVTAGPMQPPRTGGAISNARRPTTAGPIAAPASGLAQLFSGVSTRRRMR